MRAIRSLICIAILATAISNTHATAVDFVRNESPASEVLSGEKYLRTELYFGLGRKNAPDVTPEEWNKFLADEVTPRFPEGLTVVEATGQWRNSAGMITHERSRMLILLYKKRDREAAGKKIDQIRVAYCKQFDQESVLRIDMSKVAVSF
jgi:Protein of unknown function (DUF3574)